MNNIYHYIKTFHHEKHYLYEKITKNCAPQGKYNIELYQIVNWNMKERLQLIENSNFSIQMCYLIEKEKGYSYGY